MVPYALCTQHHKSGIKSSCNTSVQRQGRKNAKCGANLVQSFYKTNKNREKVKNIIKKGALATVFIAIHG